MAASTLKGGDCTDSGAERLARCHGVSWGGSVNIAISAIAYLFRCSGPTCSMLLRAAIV